MIDFKEEISKYQPILSVDDVEDVVSNEFNDIIDLLQYIARQIPRKKE